jgi:Ca-activated chloride channel family protein
MRRPQTLVILSFLALPLFAQAPLIERIDVSVVNVDVTVTDRAGHPVRGLTRDDFEIFEDGAPQPITNFYVVEDNGAALNARTDTPQEGDRFRRKVLLVIDRHSMTPYERDRALARIEDFINDRFRGGEYDWSIAAVDTTLRMLLPPTSDKRAIHDALNQIRHGRMPRALDNAQPSESQLWAAAIAGRSTVDAIAEATRAFGATSGKKILLLLTGQLLPNDSHIENLELAKLIALTRNDLIEEANASNVSLYIMNPEGIAAGDPSMYWLARETGGRLLPGNRIEESLRQFDSRSSNFYSLGYKPKHSDNGAYHHIAVRVKKGHYALQYRDGYTNLPDEQQIERTLGSSFGTFMIAGSAIPVTVSFEKQRDVGDAVIMSMKTSVPTERLTFIPSADGSSGRVDIFVSVFDSAGTNVWSVRLTRDATLAKNDAPTGTFNEATEVYLLKGKAYRVVVAVRDQLSEAVGVTQQIVRF